MKKLSIFIISLFFCSVLVAQEKEVHVSLETQGIVTTNDVVPFWFRSNQYGSKPLPGGSGSLIARIRKDYDTTKTFGWAASFEGRGNLGQTSQFILVEGIVKAHAGIFELKAGRSKDIIGLTDSTLSSGSFAVSGNALGIPSISLSIPNYYSIPVLGKLFAIKGAYINGYAGHIDAHYGKNQTNYKSYFLSNSLYMRFGKPSWRLKLQAGYNHEALWGDEKKIFPKFQLSGWDTYKYVLLGKVYQGSKVGNHLGSLDVGAEYKFDAFTVTAYRQSFYDKGGLGSLANVKDGLNGLSFVNNNWGSDNFQWKKMVFEFLYTANQAGTESSRRTKSGAEDYYNNYEYEEGWSYNAVGLGTPFITTANDLRKDQAASSPQFFKNNRVMAFHLATQLYAFKWLYTGKLSYSVNYGTFETGTELYRSLGGNLKAPTHPGSFTQVNQLSAYVEGMRPLKNGYNVGYNVGYDHGGLLYNSFGIILKASKTFL